MEYRYQGIILSKYDIAEVDRFYVVFTRETGKIRAVGKGVRNPDAKLAGNLEPVTLSEISISRTKGRGKITGAIAANNFLAIKSNYHAMARVFYIFGIIEKMITDEEKDERVFDLILNFLKTLDDSVLKGGSEEKIDVLTLGFLFQLLHILGYGLNMECCIKCNEKLLPENNYFSAAAGGVFCRECANPTGRKVKINSGTIKLIRLFVKNKIQSFTKLTVSKEDISNSKVVVGEMVRWIIE